MEAIILEVAEFGFGAAFTGLLVLLAVAAVTVLAGMAEGEKAGARYTWAAEPLPGAVEEPVEKEKVRLAA